MRRERVCTDRFGCIRVVILIVGTQWHGHGCLISKPARQTEHRHDYNPPNHSRPLSPHTISFFYSSSSNLPQCLAPVSLPLFSCLEQAAAQTHTSLLSHAYAPEKEDGERGPRLSQSQTTWRPVTGLPTKSTVCTVGVGGQWRGRGGTAAHKELLTLPCESKVSLCGWLRGSDHVAFLLQIQEVSGWSGFDCFSLMCCCVVFCKHQCMKGSYSTVALV